MCQQEEAYGVTGPDLGDVENFHHRIQCISGPALSRRDSTAYATSCAFCARRANTSYASSTGCARGTLAACVHRAAATSSRARNVSSGSRETTVYSSAIYYRPCIARRTTVDNHASSRGRECSGNVTARS